MTFKLDGDEKNSQALFKLIGNFCVLFKLCKLIFIFLSFLQRSLQYFISCHTFFHFLRQINGFKQIVQVLTGKSDFNFIFDILFKHKLSKMVVFENNYLTINLIFVVYLG